MSLLLSIFDDLNKLCEILSRLDYVIQRKKMLLSKLDFALTRENIEQILCMENKGEKK